MCVRLFIVVDDCCDCGCVVCECCGCCVDVVGVVELNGVYECL